MGLVPRLSLGFPGNGLPMLPSLPTGRIARPRDFWEITGNIPRTRGSLASPRPPMGLAPSSREARSQKPGVILRTRGFVGKQGNPLGAKGQSWALRVFALANSVREVRKERTLTLSVQLPLKTEWGWDGTFLPGAALQAPRPQGPRGLFPPLRDLIGGWLWFSFPVVLPPGTSARVWRFQSLQVEGLGPLLATRGLRRGPRKVQGGPTAERDPAPVPMMPQANPEGRRPVLLCIPPKAEPEARLGYRLFCKGHLRSREE